MRKYRMLPALVFVLLSLPMWSSVNGILDSLIIGGLVLCGGIMGWYVFGIEDWTGMFPE